MDSSFKLFRCRSVAFSALLWLLAVALHPPVVMAEVEFIRSIDDGGKVKYFREISGLALEKGDTVIIADGGTGRLVSFTRTRTKSFLLSRKHNLIKSKSLGGLVTTVKGILVVVASGDNQILVLDKKRVVKLTIGDSGGAGKLNSPAAIAYSDNERFYVADKGRDRVAVFGRDGVFLYAFGDRGTDSQRLSRPTHIGVDAEERIYVLDRADGGRLSVFDPKGNLLGRVSANTIKDQSERKPGFTAMAVDRAGRLFVADSGNGKLIELDWKNSKAVSSFGSRGKGRGQFRKISALALSEDARLAIGDNGNHKVEVYQLTRVDKDNAERIKLPNISRGRFHRADCSRAYAMPGGDILCLNKDKKKVSRLDSNGKLKLAFAATFRKPVAAAFDEKSVVVLDDRSFKVFTHQGKLRFSAGRSGSRDGQFRSPQSVAIRGGRIYVADTGNRRIQVFSRDGVFLSKVANKKGAPPLFRRPIAVTVDSQGNFYVADEALNKVKIFSARNKLKYELGGDEKSTDRFTRLRDISVDGDDNLYVLCAIPGNAQTIRVYSGPRLIFRFGALSNTGSGMADPRSLSVVSARKTTVSVYDARRKGLIDFRFLQVPARVGGVVVEGGLEQTRVSWQSVPGSYIAKYAVYGATSGAGPFELIRTSKHTETTIKHKDGQRYSHFRISAISGFNIEGLAARAQKDLFQVGYASYVDKQYDQAFKVFTETLKANPKHAFAMEYAGRSLVALARYQESIHYFTELAKHEGFELLAIRLHAEALFRAKKFIQARAVLDLAFARKNISTAAYVLCGELSLKMGDAIGAVNCLEKALKRDTNNVTAHFLLGRAYVHVGVVAKGLVEYDTAVKLDPRNADVWVQSGLAFQSLKRHKVAITRFNKALAIDRLNADARQGVAESYLATRRYNKARSIALSMAGDPNQEAAGHYLIGVIAMAKGQKNEALLALSKAGRANPDSARIWLALADVYKKIGDVAKRADSLKKAAKAEPGSFQTHYRLGRLESQRGNNEAAIVSLERAVSLEPGHFNARFMLAKIQFDVEHYQDADRHAREAARLKPKKYRPLLLLADIANKQGKNGEAIDYLRAAIKLKKTSALLHTRLGRIYFENNIFDLAQKEFERAALLAPRKADPKVLLGQLYLEIHQFDAAIRVLNQAVRLDPSADNKLLRNTAYAEKKKSLVFKGNAPRIVMEQLRLQQVFSSAYKQYTNSPVGTVKVRNISGSDYQNLSLSFHIKGYMDFPTTKDIAVLKANSVQELPLLALFNNKVLEIDEDTGVQVQLKLSFFRNGKRDSIELTQPMTIYGKNAIVWSRTNMVGSFVTPRDDVLHNFVRQGINENRPDNGPLNQNLVSAMTLFNLLSTHGLRYQVDPNNPYSRLKAKQVDYVQFPRDTLRLKSGDCDDLSVLYSAGLENLGIETAFIDVPGHLLLMFNTGLPVDKRDAISLQRDLLVEHNDSIWIPVETTMISTTFSEAWAEGARKFNVWQAKQRLKIISTRQAWATYQPVTLPPADYTIEVPAKTQVSQKVHREQVRLITKSLDRLVMPYRAMAQSQAEDTEALMQIAIIYAKYGLFSEAIKELDAILKREPKHSAAYNNRGNIYLAREQYERALDAYRYAEKLDPTDGGIKLNLAMAYYKIGKLHEASVKYREATLADKAIAGEYATFSRLLAN